MLQLLLVFGTQLSDSRIFVQENLISDLCVRLVGGDRSGCTLVGLLLVLLDYVLQFVARRLTEILNDLALQLRRLLHLIVSVIRSYQIGLVPRAAEE